MKSVILFATLFAFLTGRLTGQNITDNSGIEKLLLSGNYRKVVDTCKQVLILDSLNPDLHFKMGIAYQNMLEEDSALNSFSRAVRLNPDREIYNFMLAKGYYVKEKFYMAEPLLKRLCTGDSLNWSYANYLTGIYMQSNRYDEAIRIYSVFLNKDSARHMYIDKAAFAYLKKADFIKATDLYNKSLSINANNLTAIKNLAYLYSQTNNTDTAILLLSRGIGIDSSDIDLFARRASLFYSTHDFIRALDDYMVVLSSGDSSKLYLKRIGIGYCNNLQPAEAVRFLSLAYNKDSSDYEISSYLAQSYYKMKDLKNSIYYYNKALKILKPVSVQLGLTYILLAESQKAKGMYREAIASYKKSLDLKHDPNIYMIIANLYDEKLQEREQAIYYYQKFLDNLNSVTMSFSPEYAETIRQRLEYVKEIMIEQQRAEQKK